MVTTTEVIQYDRKVSQVSINEAKLNKAISDGQITCNFDFFSTCTRH